MVVWFFFFSSRRRHTRFKCDWSSDVCSSDLTDQPAFEESYARRSQQQCMERSRMREPAWRRPVWRFLTFLQLLSVTFPLEEGQQYFVEPRSSGSGETKEVWQSRSRCHPILRS